MRLDTVESDVIHAIGYDPEIHLLEIIFNDGRIYQYREVPDQVYVGLLRAESKGKYFQENVRDEFLYWQYDAEANRFVRAADQKAKGGKS